MHRLRVVAFESASKLKDVSARLDQKETNKSRKNVSTATAKLDVKNDERGIPLSSSVYTCNTTTNSTMSLKRLCLKKRRSRSACSRSPTTKLKKGTLKNTSSSDDVKNSSKNDECSNSRRRFNRFFKRDSIINFHLKGGDFQINKKLDKEKEQRNSQFSHETFNNKKTKIDQKQNDQNKKLPNDIFGFQKSNRTVDACLYEASCNYSNVIDKFTLRKLKRGFRSTQQKKQQPAPSMDSIYKHLKVKVLNTDSIVAKPTHSNYYSGDHAPVYNIRYSTDKQLKDNIRRKKLTKDVKVSVSTSSLAPIVKYYVDAACGYSKSALTSKKHRSRLFQHVVRLCEKVVDKLEKIKCKPSKTVRVDPTLQKERNKLISEILNDTTLKIDEKKKRPLKSYVKYACLGLVIIVWSPFLLTVIILGWILICPIRTVKFLSGNKMRKLTLNHLAKKKGTLREGQRNVKCHLNQAQPQQKGLRRSVRSLYKGLAGAAMSSFNTMLSLFQLNKTRKPTELRADPRRNVYQTMQMIYKKPPKNNMKHQKPSLTSDGMLKIIEPGNVNATKVGKVNATKSENMNSTKCQCNPKDTKVNIKLKRHRTNNETKFKSNNISSDTHHFSNKINTSNPNRTGFKPPNLIPVYRVGQPDTYCGVPSLKTTEKISHTGKCNNNTQVKSLSNTDKNQPSIFIRHNPCYNNTMNNKRALSVCNERTNTGQIFDSPRSVFSHPVKSFTNHLTTRLCHSPKLKQYPFQQEQSVQSLLVKDGSKRTRPSKEQGTFQSFVRARNRPDQRRNLVCKRSISVATLPQVFTPENLAKWHADRSTALYFTSKSVQASGKIIPSFHSHSTAISPILNKLIKITSENRFVKKWRQKKSSTKLCPCQIVNDNSKNADKCVMTTLSELTRLKKRNVKTATVKEKAGKLAFGTITKIQSFIKSFFHAPKSIKVSSRHSKEPDISILDKHRFNLSKPRIIYKNRSQIRDDSIQLDLPQQNEQDLRQKHVFKTIGMSTMCKRDLQQEFSFKTTNLLPLHKACNATVLRVSESSSYENGCHCESKTSYTSSSSDEIISNKKPTIPVPEMIIPSRRRSGRSPLSKTQYPREESNSSSKSVYFKCVDSELECTCNKKITKTTVKNLSTPLIPSKHRSGRSILSKIEYRREEPLPTEPSPTEQSSPVFGPAPKAVEAYCQNTHHGLQSPSLRRNQSNCTDRLRIGSDCYCKSQIDSRVRLWQPRTVKNRSTMTQYKPIGTCSVCGNPTKTVKSPDNKTIRGKPVSLIKEEMSQFKSPAIIKHFEPEVTPSSSELDDQNPTVIKKAEVKETSSSSEVQEQFPLIAKRSKTKEPSSPLGKDMNSPSILEKMEDTETSSNSSIIKNSEDSEKSSSSEKEEKPSPIINDPVDLGKPSLEKLEEFKKETFSSVESQGELLSVINNSDNMNTSTSSDKQKSPSSTKKGKSNKKQTRFLSLTMNSEATGTSSSSEKQRKYFRANKNNKIVETSLSFEMQNKSPPITKNTQNKSLISKKIETTSSLEEPRKFTSIFKKSKTTETTTSFENRKKSLSIFKISKATEISSATKLNKSPPIIAISAATATSSSLEKETKFPLIFTNSKIIGKLSSLEKKRNSFWRIKSSKATKMSSSLMARPGARNTFSCLEKGKKCPCINKASIANVTSSLCENQRSCSLINTNSEAMEILSVSKRKKKKEERKKIIKTNNHCSCCITKTTKVAATSPSCIKRRECPTINKSWHDMKTSSSLETKKECNCMMEATKAMVTSTSYEQQSKCSSIITRSPKQKKTSLIITNTECAATLSSLEAKKNSSYMIKTANAMETNRKSQSIIVNSKVKGTSTSLTKAGNYAPIFENKNSKMVFSPFKISKQSFQNFKNKINERGLTSFEETETSVGQRRPTKHKKDSHCSWQKVSKCGCKDKNMNFKSSEEKAPLAKRQISEVKLIEVPRTRSLCKQSSETLTLSNRESGSSFLSNTQYGHEKLYRRRRSCSSVSDTPPEIKLSNSSKTSQCLSLQESFISSKSQLPNISSKESLYSYGSSIQSLKACQSTSNQDSDTLSKLKQKTHPLLRSSFIFEDTRKVNDDLHIYKPSRFLLTQKEKSEKYKPLPIIPSECACSEDEPELFGNDLNRQYPYISVEAGEDKSENEQIRNCGVKGHYNQMSPTLIKTYHSRQNCKPIPSQTSLRSLRTSYTRTVIVQKHSSSSEFTSDIVASRFRKPKIGEKMHRKHFRKIQHKPKSHTRTSFTRRDSEEKMSSTIPSSKLGAKSSGTSCTTIFKSVSSQLFETSQHLISNIQRGALITGMCTCSDYKLQRASKKQTPLSKIPIPKIQFGLSKQYFTSSSSPTEPTQVRHVTKTHKTPHKYFSLTKQVKLTKNNNKSNQTSKYSLSLTNSTVEKGIHRLDKRKILSKDNTQQVMCHEQNKNKFETSHRQRETVTARMCRNSYIKQLLPPYAPLNRFRKATASESKIKLSFFHNPFVYHQTRSDYIGNSGKIKASLQYQCPSFVMAPLPEEVQKCSCKSYDNPTIYMPLLPECKKCCSKKSSLSTIGKSSFKDWEICNCNRNKITNLCCPGKKQVSNTQKKITDSHLPKHVVCDCVDDNDPLLTQACDCKDKIHHFSQQMCDCKDNIHHLPKQTYDWKEKVVLLPEHMCDCRKGMPLPEQVCDCKDKITSLLEKVCDCKDTNNSLPEQICDCKDKIQSLIDCMCTQSKISETKAGSEGKENKTGPRTCECISRPKIRTDKADKAHKKNKVDTPDIKADKVAMADKVAKAGKVDKTGKKDQVAKVDNTGKKDQAGSCECFSRNKIKKESREKKDGIEKLPRMPKIEKDRSLRDVGQRQPTKTKPLPDKEIRRRQTTKDTAPLPDKHRLEVDKPKRPSSAELRSQSDYSHMAQLESDRQKLPEKSQLKSAIESLDKDQLKFSEPLSKKLSSTVKDLVETDEESTPEEVKPIMKKSASRDAKDSTPIKMPSRAKSQPKSRKSLSKIETKKESSSQDKGQSEPSKQKSSLPVKPSSKTITKKPSSLDEGKVKSDMKKSLSERKYKSRPSLTDKTKLQPSKRKSSLAVKPDSKTDAKESSTLEESTLESDTPKVPSKQKSVKSQSERLSVKPPSKTIKKGESKLKSDIKKSPSKQKSVKSQTPLADEGRLDKVEPTSTDDDQHVNGKHKASANEEVVAEDEREYDAQTSPIPVVSKKNKSKSVKHKSIGPVICECFPKLKKKKSKAKKPQDLVGPVTCKCNPKSKKPKKGQKSEKSVKSPDSKSSTITSLKKRKSLDGLGGVCPTCSKKSPTPCPRCTTKQRLLKSGAIKSLSDIDRRTTGIRVRPFEKSDAPLIYDRQIVTIDKKPQKVILDQATFKKALEKEKKRQALNKQLIRLKCEQRAKQLKQKNELMLYKKQHGGTFKKKGSNKYIKKYSKPEAKDDDASSRGFGKCFYDLIHGVGHLEKKAWPLPIKCQPLYIHIMKERPCLWIYKAHPRLYPYFLGVFKMFKYLTGCLVQGLLGCILSPLLGCCYLCLNCLICSCK